MNEFIRTRLLFGDESMEKLQNAKVAVFGIGGVGGHCAEALIRSGIGSMDIFDNDDVSVSNINRQIVALHSTVGKKKVDVMKERALDINPNINITAYDIFFDEKSDIDFSSYDFIVDAIDTVTSKLLLIKKAKENSVPIICSMGAGNKLDPTGFMIADISKTEVCPLARVMRKKLSEMKIKDVPVVFSKEIAIKPIETDTELKGGRPAPGSNAFVPSVVGLIIASYVCRTIVNS